MCFLCNVRPLCLDSVCGLTVVLKFLYYRPLGGLKIFICRLYLVNSSWIIWCTASVVLTLCLNMEKSFDVVTENNFRSVLIVVVSISRIIMESIIIIII